MTGVEIVFGSAGPLWCNDETGPKVLEILRAEGIKRIDSARIYGESEECIGKRGVATSPDFIVDTKHPGGLSPQGATKEDVIESGQLSLKLIQTKQVDIYYLHCPSPDTPLESTLEGVNELYQQGAFKRFGLSNYSAAEVAAVIKLCQEKGFVQPTAYEGNYNAVSRLPEAELMPLLRKHGIPFFAYSPVAGGFLTKTRADVEAGKSRFNPKEMLSTVYRGMYAQPPFLDALDKWNALSEESGIPRAELATRWAFYHSALDGKYGDGAIIGASSLKQLKETIAGVKRGPLPGDLPQKIDALWGLIKDDAHEQASFIRVMQQKFKEQYEAAQKSE